jgi:hypothetical protein
MIRQDKVNYVLPKAMRRHGIDMWIVIDHGRGIDRRCLILALKPPMVREFMSFTMAAAKASRGYASAAPADLNCLTYAVFTTRSRAKLICDRSFMIATRNGSP